MTDHLDEMPETETAFETTEIAAAEETKAASQFLDSFEAFKTDVSERLGALDARIGTLQTKAARRPALSMAADVAAPHQKAFSAFLRRGDESGMESLGLETKGLNTQSPTAGGHLVDPRTAEAVDAVLRGGGSLRAVANVVQVEATAYDVLIDRAELGAGWLDEVTPVTETTGPTIERISIALHELSANPQASQRILDDSAFDLEMWLAGRIGDRFRRAEATAFIKGTGSGQPKGIMTHPFAPNSGIFWGELGYVTTGNAGDFDVNDPGDALVDLVYSLGAEYRTNGTFIMSSATAAEVRKLKDSQGRFLWIEGISEASPARLLGYPVLIAEDMDPIATDSISILFGDFSRGYTVAERPEIHILRDPFSAKPNVSFFAVKRVGGDVTDFKAIKGLKFGTA
ncbi:MAG: phage major capsid protein [Pseudomonadota bacterium]